MRLYVPGVSAIVGGPDVTTNWVVEGVVKRGRQDLFRRPSWWPHPVPRKSTIRGQTLSGSAEGRRGLDVRVLCEKLWSVGQNSPKADQDAALSSADRDGGLVQDRRVKRVVEREVVRTRPLLTTPFLSLGLRQRAAGMPLVPDGSRAKAVASVSATPGFC